MSNDSSSYKWQDGNAEMDGYTNIGETFNMKINSTTTHTFTQNELTSINYSVMSASNWVSQITEGINCFQASSKMLANEGVTSAGRGSEVIVVNLGENGRAGSGNSNLNKGVSVINMALENGNPIMVGVDYKDKSPNADGMTDHFIVISSMTEKIKNGATVNTTYNFFDPKTNQPNKGRSSNNTLSTNNSQLTGYYNSEIKYVVTIVRKNK